MNVGYQYKCNNCAKEGKHRAYDGETCRNLYNRNKEQMRDFKSKTKPSWMKKHIDKDHDGKADNIKFDMKVTGKFTKHLSVSDINPALCLARKQTNEPILFPPRLQLHLSRSQHKCPRAGLRLCWTHFI